MTQPGPRFIHDSACCAFLGRLDVPAPWRLAGGYDAYYCPKTGSVLVRCGHDGPEYTSCQPGPGWRRVFELDIRLAMARQMAVDAGWLEGPPAWAPCPSPKGAAVVAALADLRDRLAAGEPIEAVEVRRLADGTVERRETVIGGEDRDV